MPSAVPPYLLINVFLNVLGLFGLEIVRNSTRKLISCSVGPMPIYSNAMTEQGRTTLSAVTPFFIISRRQASSATHLSGTSLPEPRWAEGAALEEEASLRRAKLQLAG